MTSIEVIDREAKEAAERGQSPDQACRWPLTLPEGERWLETYNSALLELESA